jgi:hypothetical protein
MAVVRLARFRNTRRITASALCGRAIGFWILIGFADLVIAVNALASAVEVRMAASL